MCVRRVRTTVSARKLWLPLYVALSVEPAGGSFCWVFGFGGGVLFCRDLILLIFLPVCLAADILRFFLSFYLFSLGSRSSAWPFECMWRDRLGGKRVAAARLSRYGDGAGHFKFMYGNDAALYMRAMLFACVRASWRLLGWWWCAMTMIIMVRVYIWTAPGLSLFLVSFCGK